MWKIGGDFGKTKKNNITGSRGNKWSTITFRMALAVYIRSPAAYRALKGFHILQLPCISTLKSFTRAKLNEPGEAGDMSIRAEQYTQMQEQKAREGHTVPCNEGILIFDEVKVVQKTLFNSKSNKIIGLAMAPEDMSSLHDIYEELDPRCKQKKTNYIIQYLWRDLVCNFDVLGPYYTAHTSLEHKFLISCTIDAIVKFNAFGFKTTVIVCDGASSNLKMIKTFMGHTGTFDPAAPISPKFLNPLTNQFTYFIICPTHQLKNMIAALYSSRERGTKSFIKDGVQFGWGPIISLYAEDLERARQQLNVHVPGMKLNYVVRDPWTRLNVKPAKIMQQTACIAALQNMAAQSDNPAVQKTVEYLQACNKLFESGFLSKYCVSAGNRRLLEIIDEGMSFFNEWRVSVARDFPEDKLTGSNQKHFLAWQTWELMRVAYYGLFALCDDFINRHPQYLIYPSRINGRAVETLFSQFKYITGGKLSAVNYDTARAAYLTKVDVHGRKFNDDYRNAPLYIQQGNLHRL